VRVKPFALLIVCTLPLTINAAQQSLPLDRPGAPPFAVDVSPEQARILAGIRGDDLSSFVEAGKSRNRTFLEPLRGALRRQPSDKKGIRFTQLHEALAQLGDTESLQALWCLSINDRNSASELIAWQLARVGGWFSVQVFDYLLSPRGRVHWERAMERHPKDSDVLILSPDHYIALAFPRVVVNPPAVILKKPLADSQAVSAMLRAWIAEHRPELSLLQPTGEGVDLSPTACKDGKPRERR
jgi:hypothetical protein